MRLAPSSLADGPRGKLFLEDVLALPSTPLRVCLFSVLPIPAFHLPFPRLSVSRIGEGRKRTTGTRRTSGESQGGSSLLASCCWSSPGRRLGGARSPKVPRPTLSHNPFTLSKLW